MEPRSKSRILVTGSAGFIGQKLVTRLLKDGFRNLTLVDINQGTHRKGVVSIKGSFSDVKLMKTLLPGQDYVFHLAALVGVFNTLNDKAGLRNTNLVEAKKFIDLVAESTSGKLVFSSSSEVYGNSRVIPFRENGPVHPVSEYGRYKIDVEKHLQKLARLKKLKSTVVRFFNVYGPGQRTAFVVNRFLENAQKGEDLIVNWDGSQTRCFTFIDDAIEGLMLAMKYERKPFNIFNIGSDRESSVLELAKLAIEAVGSTRSDIVIVNKHKVDRYEILRRVPSIQKARKELGYAPRVDLEQGLLKILNDK